MRTSSCLANITHVLYVARHTKSFPWYSPERAQPNAIIRPAGVRPQWAPVVGRSGQTAWKYICTVEQRTVLELGPRSNEAFEEQQKAEEMSMVRIKLLVVSPTVLLYESLGVHILPYHLITNIILMNLSTAKRLKTMKKISYRIRIHIILKSARLFRVRHSY